MEEERSAEKVTVRGFDPALWRELRAEAIRRGLSGGQLLSQIVREWLARQKESRGRE